MTALAARIVQRVERILGFCVVCEVVVEEVGRNEDADHVADIVVTAEGKRKGKHEELVFAEFDHLLDAVGKHGKPDDGVDPHRVVLLHDAVGRHCVEGGKGDDGDLTAGVFLRVAVEIPAEGETAKTGFEEEDRQKRFKDAFLREERNDIREGGGKIVSVNAHKLAAERSLEGIDEARVAVDRRAEHFVEGNVLTVQVEDQHRAVAEGMETHREIDEEKECDGGEERVVEVRVFVIREESAQALRKTRRGAKRCEKLCVWCIVHVIHVLSCLLLRCGECVSFSLIGQPRGHRPFVRE